MTGKDKDGGAAMFPEDLAERKPQVVVFEFAFRGEVAQSRRDLRLPTWDDVSDEAAASQEGPRRRRVAARVIAHGADCPASLADSSPHRDP